MEITLDMLCHALRGDYPDVRLESGTSPAAFRQIHLHRGAESLRKDVLYLKGSCLFFDETEKGRILFPKRKDEIGLFESVLACRDRLLAWDNRICETILRQHSLEELLALAQPYLHYSYSLIDRDMHVLYESPYRPARDRSLSESRGTENERYMPEEAVRMRMLERSFQEAVRSRDSYYYQDETMDRDCFSRNIFVNGAFHACFVLYLPAMGSRLSKGEEQLFDHFASRVEQFIQSRPEYQHLPSSDTLHGLCRALTAGNSWDSVRIRYALDQTSWRYQHRFLVLSLAFSEQSAMQNSSEVALRYLVAEAEKQWQGCAAVPAIEETLCVIDLDCMFPEREEKEALRSFYTELAVFVREHVILAGVSAVCPDISGIHRASMQARTARDIGARRGTGPWYFLFDTYRTDYSIEVLRGSAYPLLGPNPTLRILSAHDRAHHTEYVGTLRAFLDCRLNMQAAADKMFIHRTTFCRRMDQIQKITGIKDFSPDLLFELELALRVEAEEG